MMAANARRIARLEGFSPKAISRAVFLTVEGHQWAAMTEAERNARIASEAGPLALGEQIFAVIYQIVDSPGRCANESV